jgi:rRNA maturation endonuclease Nob1
LFLKTDMLELPIAAVIYCALVAAVFLGLWFYYDRREHARFEVQRRKTTFHCIRCDQLYPAPAGTELCVCPRCGHENARLKF